MHDRLRCSFQQSTQEHAIGLALDSQPGHGCSTISNEVRTTVLKSVFVKIDDIYIPTDRRKELDLEKADELALQMIDDVYFRPIHIREGKGRYVLVKGVNRLEARRSLGDETVEAYIVSAQKH